MLSELQNDTNVLSRVRKGYVDDREELDRPFHEIEKIAKRREGVRDAKIHFNVRKDFAIQPFKDLNHCFRC